MTVSLERLSADQDSFRKSYEQQLEAFIRAIVEVYRRGGVPREQDLENCFALRKRFCEHRIMVSETAKSLGAPAVNVDDVTTLKQLEDIVESARVAVAEELRRQEEERKRQEEERKRVEAVNAILDRVAGIAHKEKAEFGPLVEIRATIAALRERATGGVTADADLVALLAGEHPMQSLLRIVDESDKLSDDEWVTAQDVVAKTYGGEMTTAIARGRLVRRDEPTLADDGQADVAPRQEAQVRENSAREEAQRKQAEARERAAREEAERREAEAREKAAREEAERKEAEAREKAAREEAERKEAEAREKAAREEAERKEAEAREKAAREEAERKLAEAREKAAREEAERKEAEAREKAEREEADRKEAEAREKAAREEAEQKEAEARERAAREEAEQKEAEAREKAAREEAEQKEAEARERAAREEAERKEAEAREKAAREEAERKEAEAREKAAREEAERKAAAARERAAREEAERKAAEARERVAREEAERKAAEARERAAREEAARREAAAREQAARERAAREEAEQEAMRQEAARLAKATLAAEAAARAQRKAVVADTRQQPVFDPQTDLDGDDIGYDPMTAFGSTPRSGHPQSQAAPRQEAAHAWANPGWSAQGNDAGSVDDLDPVLATPDGLAIWEREPVEEICVICGDMALSHRCQKCGSWLDLGDIDALFNNDGSNRAALEQAVEHYRSQPEHPERDRSLAVALLNLHRPSEAIPYLTALVQVDPQDPAARTLADLRGRKTVLMVDDDAKANAVFARTLHRNGFNTVLAGDAFEVAPLAREVQVDLVLLNANMAGMDGYTLANLLRSDAATQHIPIVMVTAENGLMSRMRSRFSGVDAFFTKPFDTTKLLSTLHKALSSQPGGHEAGQESEEKRTVPLG